MTLDTLPKKHFQVIYCDVPWRFQPWSERGEGKSASQHYQCMGLEDIAGLSVADVAAENCALFFWVVQSMLPEALYVLERWSFTFKTVAYCWIKLKGKQDRLFYAGEDVRMGMGYHTRAGMEQCWLATRGKGYERLSKGEAQVVFSPLREHSRKPDEVATSIENLVGDVPKLEMFARTERPGWTSFGLETSKFSSGEGDVVSAGQYGA